ncbi:MAG: hypothetical protein P8X88_04735 [Gammaproteobacteria bacterium]
MIIETLNIAGQSDMEDNFDTAIHEVVEEFENIPTTEDTRVGIDRRHLCDAYLAVNVYL